MAAAEESHLPRQVMGLRDLVLFYIVTGISLRWIATAAAVGAASVVVWLVAWCAFYLPLALSVMELSSRYPQEGGLYVWSKRAFGEFPGFLTGWTYWASNLPYYSSILYFTAGNALYIGSARWQSLSNDKTYFLIFSVLGLALAAILNLVGLSVGKWLHNLGAIGTWLPIALLIGIAGVAWRRFGSATHFTASTMAPHMHFRDVLFMATIVFALGGSESASFMGGEVRDAKKNLPRGLLAGGVFVTIGYIVGTIAVLVTLPAHQVSGLQGIMQSISQAGEKVGFRGIGPLAALLITIGNLGALGAWLAVSARLPFVAGLDRYLPSVFARIHPKWGTPHVALLTQTVCGLIFVLLGQAGTSVYGAYEVLVSMGIISYFIPYLFVFASLIRLQREPPDPGVLRIPGGKRVAIAIGVLGFVSTSVTILFSLMPAADEPHPVFAVLKIVVLTAFLILLGVFTFHWGKSKAARESAAHSPVAS
ncbi:MAG TPA: APC family permease [Verrucomicrobiae bacterium]|nr:APC family permease [Verrucomicrobiae bacterium]